MKKIAIGIITITVITIIAVIFLLPTVSKKPTSFILSPTSRESLSPKRVIGFFPYWQMQSLESLDFTLLDEVMYFGFGIDEKGEFTDKAARLKSLKTLQKYTGKTAVSIVLILQDNEHIEMFLKSQSTQKNLIQNVSALITQNTELKGINVDFEYAGIPAKETVTGYTDFVATFVNELKTHYPSLIVSVDITADAMKKSRLYNVEKLALAADAIILMGYDFYRPTSDVAGPVAPLTGKELYEYDVTTAVSDFLTVVPPEKLILGVPYYGWDFPTESEQRGSFVEKRPDEAVALSSYRRTKRLIEETSPLQRFDQESQTPWMIYRDPDTDGIRQVWYENAVSLGKKYDLVNRQNLAGIAIWALGYEGDAPELKELLEEKFGNSK